MCSGLITTRILLYVDQVVTSTAQLWNTCRSASNVMPQMASGSKIIVFLKEDVMVLRGLYLEGSFLD